MGIRGVIAVCCSASFLAFSALAAPDWEKTVTPLQRGDFPNPRPIVASYNFGWNELVAATAEIQFGKTDTALQLLGSGQTVGLVRALWKFDVQYRALADPLTLRPLSMHQVDEVRNKTVVTDLTFLRDSVERVRADNKTKNKAKPKTFTFAGGVFDMHSALLFLRSQPLRQGDIYRVVVYPATSAFLVTLTVVERAPLVVEAGTYPAIKLDVKLSKIGKKRELEPHKKFRSASVWVSDDSDRLLLRVEASIFVGKVFTELRSVRFPEAKP